MTDRPPSPANTDPPPRRLATFFCPECGHENPVDGDWIVRSPNSWGQRRRRYRCPDCRTLVLDNPIYDDEHSRSSLDPVSLGRATLDMWTSACRRWSDAVSNGFGRVDV